MIFFDFLPILDPITGISLRRKIANNVAIEAGNGIDLYAN